jgi:hypothetical protein
MVPYLGDPQDLGALAVADLLSRVPGVEVVIMHLVSAERKKASPFGVSDMVQRQSGGKNTQTNVRLEVVETTSPSDKVVEESHRFDLVVLGLSPTWKWNEGWLSAKQESVAQQSMCSLLIVRASNKPSATPSPTTGGSTGADIKTH